MGVGAKRARLCPQRHPRGSPCPGSNRRMAGSTSPRPITATSSPTLPVLLASLVAEIEGWPTEQVRSVLRSERYFHAIHYPRAINIHPLNYALGLAAAAERAGVRIFEHTPALSIDPAGVRKRIVTPNARVRASHVVLCGNVQIAGLMPQIGSTLIPVTTYVITTAPLGSRSWRGDRLSRRGQRQRPCRQPLPDRRWRSADVVGPGDDVGARSAPLCARADRRYREDISPARPVAVDHAWSGTLGNSIHRMPQIGELGPGVWLASGFGGHGLNTTAMAGNLIARAIVKGDHTWRQFTPSNWFGRAEF